MNDGRTPSRSWQARPPTRTAYSREWRSTSERRPERFSRRFKLRAAIIGLLMVFGIIVVLLAPTSSQIPPIQVVTFGIGVYGGRTNPQQNLPVNPFGEQDAKAFQILHDLHPIQFLPVRQEANVLNGAQFLTFLRAESQANELARKNLIVFCTMHAVMLPSGSIELFAIDATPDSPGSSSGKMIPLSDVVTCLEQSTAKRVLLILDVARLESDWRMGIVVNDLAAQITSEWPAKEFSLAEKASANSSRVTIILPSGPGQRSWSADRNSVFVRFLIEGLLGPADGWVQDPKPGNTGPHDRRVSLKELFAFTKWSVNDWTIRHFGVPQSIQLAGNTSDIDLATVSPQYQNGSNPITDALAVQSELTKGKPQPESKADAKAPPNQAATKGDQSAKTEASGDSPDRPKSADSRGAESKSPATSNAEPWSEKLTELRKARDLLRDAAGAGRNEVCRVNPLLWRTFEARLAFAGELEDGGAEELVSQVVDQAKLAYQKLTGHSTTTRETESSIGDVRQQLLKDQGFVSADPPSPEALVAVEKYLQGLAKSASTPPAPTGKEIAEPNPSVVQEWFKRELLRDRSPENWKRLQQSIESLDQNGRQALTDDIQFLREVLSAEDAANRFAHSDVLQRMLILRDRLRKLAFSSPESSVLCRNTINASLHSLYAAEQWMLATSVDQLNVREWLEKSERASNEIEQVSRRYLETIGVWSDLLAELPAIAQWMAVRADNDDSRKLEWSRLREIARHWSDRERDGKWDVESFRNLWFDKPARMTDIERLVLAQFVGAQKLKRSLLATSESSFAEQITTEDLPKVATQALRDQSDMREEFRRIFPRLGTADFPTPLLRYEADQLLHQSWITVNERRKLSDLLQFDPRGDSLTDRSPATQSIWQGFWSIATLGLLSSPDDTDEILALWKIWDRLAEMSDDSSSSRATAADLEPLRKRQSELGRAIRQEWSSLENRAQSSKAPRSLAKSHLIAATVDPTSMPEVDPDNVIRDERQKQFLYWIAEFASDFRNRATSSSISKLGYAQLVQKLDGLLTELGPSVNKTPVVKAGFQQVIRPTFDASRRSVLEVSILRPDTESATPLHLHLIGSRIRFLDSNNARSKSTLIKSVPNDGQMKISIQLDDEVDVPVPLLLLLTEEDDCPIEFQRIQLLPPFDPSQWRIEFTDAVTGTSLEHIPILGTKGTRFFLPPASNVSLKANLVRPEKDLSKSVKINVFAMSDTGRIPLISELNVPLESGKTRTPLTIDVPAAVQEKDAPPKDKTPPPPVAELARGMIFEMIPEGQKPIEYRAQPTFWSAAKFINDPRPVIRDDRFSLDLERRSVTGEDVLLPKKIAVELSLPDSLRNTLTDYTLGGPVAVGQKLTLSFKLPKNWSDLTREQNWNIALDVAGLPHPYRWRIDPSGAVLPISGQPPQLNIRLLLPPPAPKTLPRREPILFQGKDPLHLQFQVDATELDRTDELGDWMLSYSIVRASNNGYEPTPLQGSWRLFSSVQRHIVLEGIKGGVWKIQTQATNYDREEADADVRGLSGRFQVQATLTRSSAPTTPLATASLKFAIDDEAPPSLDVKDLGLERRMTDKDIRCRIEAADLESGIQSIAYGFDNNSDKQLQTEEEALEEHEWMALENPKVSWPIVIPKSKLPKLEKDEETRNLIVVAKNGLGIATSRTIPVTLRKPALPKKPTTGTLVVSLKTSRGAKTTIQISGPTSKLEETSEDTVTFPELPPGQYQISVKVTYAVIGRKDEGEAKVEVKMGETTTAKVPLNIVTGK